MRKFGVMEWNGHWTVLLKYEYNNDQDLLHHITKQIKILILAYMDSYLIIITKNYIEIHMLTV